MEITEGEESDINNNGDKPHSVSFGEATKVWCKVALLSFGGPAGQIAVMHRILVEEKRWVSENRFLHALNYCMLLPGPEAQQLATYIGWLLHRTAGGLVAGLLFILPGFLSIMLLSILYAGFNDMTLVQGIFFGLKPAVVAVVVEAVIRIGKRALRNRTMIFLAGSSFVAIFFFQIPFPLIILAAASIGFIGGRLRPDVFLVVKKTQPGDMGSTGPAISDDQVLGTRPGMRRTFSVLATWLPLWFLPVAAIWWTTGRDSVYTQEAMFFSKASTVTFGGAYAVLAYIAQEAVTTHQWLEPGEMLDGLGMAETTPGPLIQVVQFVGFVGAHRNPGDLNPIASGVIGSVITTWVTFVPCFLWIFLGAPYIEQLRGRKSLNAALSAITAAVVGVILNLSIWFALHTLFGTINELHFGGAKLMVPDWNSIDLAALAISAMAFLLLFKIKAGMLPTLAISAATGIIWYWTTAN